MTELPKSEDHSVRQSPYPWYDSSWENQGHEYHRMVDPRLFPEVFSVFCLEFLFYFND